MAETDPLTEAIRQPNLRQAEAGEAIGNDNLRELGNIAEGFGKLLVHLDESRGQLRDVMGAAYTNVANNIQPRNVDSIMPAELDKRTYIVAVFNTLTQIGSGYVRLAEAEAERKAEYDARAPYRRAIVGLLSVTWRAQEQSEITQALSDKFGIKSPEDESYFGFASQINRSITDLLEADIVVSHTVVDKVTDGPDTFVYSIPSK